MRVQINGNPDLKPEKALNFDLGFEVEKGRTFGKLTYFHNKVEDLIDLNNVTTFLSFFPPRRLTTGTYGNIDSATLQGIELEARQALGGGFSLRGLYTYLDARDDRTGLRLKDRPYHKASLQLSYDDRKNGWNATLWNDWTAGYRHEEIVGRRTTYKDVSLSILNFVVSKKINDHFSAYLGIDNIFDKESTALAYDGRIWRGGVRMTF